MCIFAGRRTKNVMLVSYLAKNVSEPSVSNLALADSPGNNVNAAAGSHTRVAVWFRTGNALPLDHHGPLILN